MIVMLTSIIILGMDKKILQLDRLKDTIKPVTMGLRVNPKLKLQLAKEASENKMTLGKFVLKILTNNNKPVKLKKMKNFEATRGKIKMYLNALKERYSTVEWREYHANKICKEFQVSVLLPQLLKNEGYYVRVCDIKQHEYFTKNEFCNEFILGDLRDPLIVSQVMFAPGQTSLDDKENSFDEVYQLAADMGGAGYIFTGDNDANVMHNSALVNLNVVHYATKFNVKKVFYSSSACMYPEHNQLDSNKIREY